MGVVWLARDGKLDRDVALKFLPEEVAQDADAILDMKRETRRALELTHPIIVRIYDFVDYAHTEAKIAHRDLKPANLMLDSKGSLKVADFGISATLTDSATRASRSVSSTSGTPVYMSPQQMMGESPQPTDDIYVLGATVYELLTGKRELGVKGAAPIPEAWEKTVAACLAKEAAQRPQSVAEVWERLSGKVAPQATSAACRRRRNGNTRAGR